MDEMDIMEMTRKLKPMVQREEPTGARIAVATASCWYWTGDVYGQFAAAEEVEKL